jgi:hypothetical protein
MATVDDVVSYARSLLRDYPKYYESKFTGDGATGLYRMPQPYIKTLLISKRLTTPVNLAEGVDYTVDKRDGVVTFNSPLTLDVEYWATGTCYEWFLDEDLALYARMAVGNIGYQMPTFNFADLQGPDSATPSPIFELITATALVDALWALLSEYSRDIDVGTPEGLHIPASQRFHQTYSLMEYWRDRQHSLATALNLGVDRIEVLNMRRVSYTTGRLVPLYVAREVEASDPPVRIYPPIDDGVV